MTAPGHDPADHGVSRPCCVSSQARRQECLCETASGIRLMKNTLANDKGNGPVLFERSEATIRRDQTRRPWHVKPPLKHGFLGFFPMLEVV